ncbi:MAG: hypothetical protein AABN95_22500 [Acidobacteriota bacterium]
MPQLAARRLFPIEARSGLRLIVLGTALILVNPGGACLARAQRSYKPVSKESSKLASCLPSNIRIGEVAVYRRPGNVTVGEKLKALKARCRKGRIVGSNNREIRFFRLECWGFPAPDYLEIQAEQKRKLDELKAKYTVIVIGCDPRLP